MKLNRLTKRETQITTYRAQLILDAKAAKNKKKKQKKKTKQKNNKKNKKHCAKYLAHSKNFKKCATPDCFNKNTHCTNDCFIAHSEKKKEFERKKKKKINNANTNKKSENNEFFSKYAYVFKIQQFFINNFFSFSNITFTFDLINE